MVGLIQLWVRSFFPDRVEGKGGTCHRDGDHGFEDWACPTAHLSSGGHPTTHLRPRLLLGSAATQTFVLPLLRTVRGFRLLGSRLLGVIENLGGMVRQVMGSRAGI